MEADGMSTSCAPPVLYTSLAVHKDILYTRLLGCQDESFSGAEEGWQHRRAGLLDSLGLDVYQLFGEARRLVLEDPGAGALPTCFLTPILLPVNPAALQSEWPDRTLGVAALLLCPASGCGALLCPAAACPWLQLHPGPKLGCEQRNQECAMSEVLCP